MQTPTAIVARARTALRQREEVAAGRTRIAVDMGGGGLGILSQEVVCRPWLLRGASLMGLLRRAAFLEGSLPNDRLAGALDDAPASARPGYTVWNGVALVPLIGRMFKRPPDVMTQSECEYASYEEIRGAVDGALQDPGVGAILLLVDSPGGMVDGCQELGDFLREHRAVKPIHARIEDNGHSAGYWLASQALTVVANESASLGCIGVFSILDDSSGLFEQAGIKRHLIASGKFKGVGVPGVPITEEQLAPERETIQELTALFVAAVAQGRNMDPEAVVELATGRSWQAPVARDLGLLDGVEKAEETLTRLAGIARRVQAIP